MKVYLGYHGTSSKSAELIWNTNNFKCSNNDDDWLGHGIYFFTEGINDPRDNAIEWAKNRAFKLGEQDFAILAVLVSGKNVLDIREPDGLKIYNKLRDDFIEKENKAFAKDRNFDNDDRIMWNLIAEFLELEIIIHNLYIKNKTQRIKKIRSNVPNTTVMCVKNIKNIHKDTLEIVLKGVI